MLEQCNVCFTLIAGDFAGTIADYSYSFSRDMRNQGVFGNDIANLSHRATRLW
ncbi:hypothetical protein ATN83_4166 [Raoultella ornithinolytica]|nr:hypothetical protein ATN83_4166 [Raoultella ornithinolytica]KDV95072.1 hypothetical protein AB00_0653 [Raoultella ornithinolytica 2-156-04_S1_C1]KDX15910.1 hypothetical protein AB28_0661 [Raoultella ornithinolytica 2-156-04_S1_C2]BDA56503.1 hypothetical protein NUITMVR1_41620 [Raoultella ornithinolytica]